MKTFLGEKLNKCKNKRKKANGSRNSAVKTAQQLTRRLKCNLTFLSLKEKRLYQYAREIICAIGGCTTKYIKSLTEETVLFEPYSMAL